MGKNLLLWLVIGLTLMSLFNMFSTPMQKGQKLSYSTFMQRVDQGMVETATIKGHQVAGQYRNTQGELRSYQVQVPSDDSTLTKRLLDNHVVVNVQEPEQVPFFLSVLISWFPMLLLIAVWVFFMRQMQGGGKGGALSFGKSRLRRGQAGGHRGHRVPARSFQVHPPGRQDPEGRAAGRPAGHRQDPARPRHRR